MDVQHSGGRGWSCVQSAIVTSLLLLVLSLLDGVTARPQSASCLDAAKKACVWVDWKGGEGGEGASTVHMGAACSPTPGCGCFFHSVCEEGGQDNKTVIFYCKNKKDGSLCPADDTGKTNGKFILPFGGANDGNKLKQTSKELARSLRSHQRRRRRRDAPPSTGQHTSQQGSATGGETGGTGTTRGKVKGQRGVKTMQDIPPVLRKIINRHRLQNPQSFGAGTFFLSGFSHINESLLLMNVVDANNMQEQHKPPKGHVLDSQGKTGVKAKAGASGTPSPEGASATSATSATTVAATAATHKQKTSTQKSD